ncbi:Actin-regulating kinase 1 [Leucoagaricus sp. SymC.cos]|nr:Actin-regulating kinase 1 [Leucoagaricus sp. SymC.cos]
MAAQQPYHGYTQHSKGTLMPGQTISVNKYTVQVERYLSQGGFAQVYLVRTQMPVYNTTHHVLKHVVVANELMLTEVKKEVDVMRLLRGHPNIVYLIDAAWAKMPNGAFEVYILMEYCPGGGIIDMMNRRLRERLTEAEILQMFVEVCEGVAHMHNSRPPLLHRDLKVENILQSSSTSFKLCDFGSTSTVSKPPTNSQEMRAVEADLNRHTTLQYRAPEMIDLHSRRPIDEKSDVWALGVLLYKLCYYTTPFEEHGPLAILNVQYRFPSYPVYSQQMMHLISSMLREHGAQRPTVFEVLAHVHGLRGTKSPYNYPLPTPTPLSPRRPEITSNPLEGIITYRQSETPITPKAQPTKPAELTVPPERRGRPKPSVRDGPSPSPFASAKLSPQPGVEKASVVDDSGFGADGNAAWSSAIAKHASIANRGASLGDEAWSIQSKPGPDKAAKSSPLHSDTGFNDDFAQRLWASAAGSSTSKPLLPAPDPQPHARSPKIGPLPHTVLNINGKPKLDLQVRTSKERDAFEGLGLMTPVSKPPPTLGEARKLRTGLAIMSTNVNRPIKPSPSPRLRPKAHTPRVSPTPPSRSLEPDISSWSSPRPALERATSSAEAKFPSLEELDATFSSPTGSSLGVLNKQENTLASRTPEPPSLPPRPIKVGKPDSGGPGSSTGSQLLKPSFVSSGAGGTRSEQVTGVVMQDNKRDYTRRSNDGELLSLGKPEEHDLLAASPTRPDVLNLSRATVNLDDQKPQSTVPPASSAGSKQSPFMISINHAYHSKDLLTGDDELDLPRQLFDSKIGQDVFKIRDSPSKRASVIEQSDILEATIPQQGHAPTPPAKDSSVPSNRTTSTTTMESPTVTRFMKAFPAIDTSVDTKQHVSGLTESWSPVTTTALRDAKHEGVEPSSSDDDSGPEEPVALSSISAKTKVGSQPKRKGRQSSVHDLVDLWGGGITNAKDKQPESPSTFKQNMGAIKPRSAYMPSLKPSSPPRKTSPLVIPVQINPSSHTKPELPTQPPSPSPKTGRARPQSMFIFPSKSIDNSASSSTALLPPDDVKPRSGRRTSTTDMVQHYEAIQASAVVAGNPAPPSHINPIVSTIKHSLPSNHEHLHDAPATRLPVSTTPGDSIKRGPSLAAPSRSSLSSRRTKPVPPVNSKSNDNLEVGNTSSRSRNTSLSRLEPTKLPTPPRKPVVSIEELTKQSQLEPSASTSGTNNDRSPSPERPYQGVGKLIDQWQRKSAEAEANRNAILFKRSSAVPLRRAGLVPNSGKGS